MTESDIIKYIENPGLLEKANLAELKKLRWDYPYFQTAHSLYLKALKVQNSDNFNQELSKLSANISDRDLLFKFLNTEFELITDKETEKVITADQKTDDFIPNPQLLKHKNVRRKINDSFEGMGENISETISSQLEFSAVKENDKLKYHSEIYFIEEEREGKNNIITIDADPDDNSKLKKKRDILDIDEAESAKKIERSEIAEDDKESFELIESESIENKWSDEKQKSSEYFDINNYADHEILKKDNDLISQFIQQNPRIKPKETNEENVDISEESAKEDSNLLSETLVKVYIKQGLFEKAIQSYEKLSLKYPEKSAYFASQIKILEEKINKQ
ncbi:MAG TPA: hypothetical protein DCG75_11075 [Bacteroidales bacterium]|jgi:hypothetical protein|nr:hypothetical protein [Bacteroidales bacterium]